MKKRDVRTASGCTGVPHVFTYHTRRSPVSRLRH